MEKCNITCIKVIDYHLLPDYLTIYHYYYYYYFDFFAIYYFYYYSEIAAITIAYCYCPIPALNKALCTIAMTSTKHRHDIVKTSPLRPDASPMDRRPSMILKVHRQLYADVAPINPRIFPDASPNIRRCIDDTSPKVRQYIALDHRLDIGTHRHQNTSFSSPVHRQTFWPSWDRSIIHDDSPFLLYV